MVRKKKDDVLFIVSKGGDKKPQVNFYGKIIL